MIKTHKPRGHIWTCASHFQQSVQFRNIKLEDCRPPPTEDLISDPDDDLSNADRAAKCRRIERLADDFLNGTPLFISTARPCPTTLKATFEESAWSRRESKHALPEACVEDVQGPVWADVEDGWEQLRKSRHTPRKEKKAKLQGSSRKEAPADPGPQVLQTEQAQSGCRSANATRVAKIDFQPSKEALAVAARLRARRLQRTTTEAFKDHSNSLPEELEHSTSRSAPSSTVRLRGRPDIGRERDVNWVGRRRHLSCEVSEDVSADELRCSNTDSPSRRPRPLEAQGDASPGRTLQNDSLPTASRPLISTAKSAVSALSEDASLHTAPEHTDLEGVPVSSGSSRPFHADSQRCFPSSHDVCTANRKSWPMVNRTEKDALVAIHEQNNIEQPSASSSRSGPARPLPENERQTGKAKKGKRAKSDGASAPRATDTNVGQRSALLEARHAQEQATSLPVDQQRRISNPSAYTAAAVGQDGSTPFMFRKRDLAGKGKDGQNYTAPSDQKGHQRNTVGLSGDASGSSEGPHMVGSPTVSADALRLDMSLSCDSSFPLRPNMALVDEHVNSILPPHSGKLSELKKALRRELRNSGAEILRMDGEPPSSQVDEREPSHGHTAADEQAEAQVKPAAESQWPGTQALINQAERDFFSSPLKGSSAVPNDATPLRSGAGSEPASASTVRQPLRQLSQEPQPGTQTMIDSWSPWSVVKKSTARLEGNAAPSPSTTAKAGRGQLAVSAAGGSSELRLRSDMPVHHSKHRKSSLRFSHSTMESPAQTSRIERSVRKARTSLDSTSQDHTADTLKPILRRLLGDSTAHEAAQSPHEDSMLATAVSDLQNEGTDNRFTTGPLSSYEAVQDLRDDPNPEQTLEEMTMQLLETSDIAGVLSQSA